MKQTFICHHPHYNDVTKDELRYMLRNRYHRVKFRDFVDYYEIPPEELISYLRRRGIVLLSSERRTLIELANPEPKKKEVNWYNVERMPMSVVCAMYNVSYEIIKGVRVYDVEEYKRHVNDLQNKMDSYMRDDNKDESEIKRIDLIAMRYYRGVNRKAMADKLMKTVKEIIELERSSFVTKSTANSYMQELSVTNRHVKQLRLIMDGKLKRVSESRDIPKLVRLSVFIRDGGKCCRCEEKKKLHYHHIVRFADGGENTKENLMLLCVSCHAEEHKGERVHGMLKSLISKE